eukprot:120976-Alexandrium_andersonii.AAC.1
MCGKGEPPGRRDGTARRQVCTTGRRWRVQPRMDSPGPLTLWRALQVLGWNELSVKCSVQVVLRWVTCRVVVGSGWGSRCVRRGG